MAVRELLDGERSVGSPAGGPPGSPQARDVELFAVAHGPGLIDRGAHRGPREWADAGIQGERPCCFKMRLATTALWTSSGPS